MQENKRGRGRPPATTATDLQEAAFELFMAHGYEATNAAMITGALGASRSTFFNYYRVKSDVFWLQTDAALATFETALHSTGASVPFHEAVVTAAQQATAAWNSTAVPWVLSNYELIGAPVAALESAAPRLARAQQALLLALQERFPNIATTGLLPISTGYAGALVGAVLAWAESGPGRGVLSAQMASALAPLQDATANF